MNGFINVNKCAGASSAREVNIIKRLTGTPCGHMGTLDPMASGVLPVAVGNACRLFDYFLDKRKTYVARFEFGTDSDTLDTTGTLLKTGGYVPSENEIQACLPEICGEVMQVAPKYSAKNIGGKRCYQLARAGIEFELPSKKVNIYSVKLLDRINKNTFSFEIECGGGTYIRSIARDLGAKLNTCAVMSGLVRTKSGIFSIENSVATEKLNGGNVKDYLIETQSVLPYESIIPSADEDRKLFNGLTVHTCLPDGIYKIFRNDRSFYGLSEVKHNILKVRTKLC